MSSVLLIEDDEVKRQSVANALQKSTGARVVPANSVRSAIDAIERTRFDLIVADMSLPTYDIESREKGGTPRPFGGVEVFEYLERQSSKVPVVVVTSYPAISDGTRSLTVHDLARTLRADFPDQFAGIVYFDLALADWEIKFLAVVKKSLGGAHAA